MRPEVLLPQVRPGRSTLARLQRMAERLEEREARLQASMGDRRKGDQRSADVLDAKALRAALEALKL